ncbi:phosphoglycerate dehydrogenase [Pelagicoccus sp. SDUM812003]|uniref:phosphoglycerate dehydrogenase n=1 Tax=Pelagicoccus sp. SDUM812003 TaxID=3041267 RepID=UPI00280F576E|nr:phosphoglycerate dehydrogenase [Pelagicoccus sp. SDUM812003]MDQ8204456.1 phosphoglycerate dehydrogenase [Pelagicoccus sp. SDUM812003]
MKILVADKISSIGVDFLKQQEGFEVVEAYGTYKDDYSKFLELAKGAAAIIVRSDSKVTREVIETAGSSLKAIGRAGVGVDNIDSEAATDYGVVVMNTPGGNTIATAELTFTHMLCGARPLAQAAQSMREGRWDRKIYGGSELFRKTLGICGMGRIGAEVAKRAKAFGMTVLGYDPYLTAAKAEALGVKQVDLEELFRQADYITVHMPLTDATRDMIDDKAIAMMKDGVRLFNCARGGIINEDALLKGLESGKVAAAGLDVYVSEPPAEDHPFRAQKNLNLTPHLGASTEEAQESVGLEIAECVTSVLTGGGISNAINMPSLDAQTLKTVGPYLELCSALGSLVQQLALDKVEKVKITYSGKIVDLDANSLTRGILKGYLKEVSSNVNFVNALVIMERLGLQVDVLKSSEEVDYTELIKVEAVCGNGESVSAEGTLIGKGNSPRIVSVNGREVEVEPHGCMLVIANSDELGIVGKIGSIMGKDGVNIAGMSLSRNEVGGIALNIATLDSDPSDAAMEEIRSIAAIKQAKIVHL